jgi:tRNA dimethylallyltransferase
VPINQVLRDTLSPLSITKLQEELTRLDAHKFATMNHSDSLNPRRLIRAIEITNYLNKVPNLAKDSTKLLQPQATIVGLKYFDNSNYRSKVHKRVLERLGKGAIEETKLLLTKYGNNLQSISAIGYQSIIAYLNNELSYDQMIDSWVSDELAYAKRQLTWFRKQPVIWYDVDKQ